MIETNKIYEGDCIKFMSEMDEKSIDLLITSPRYNVGIDYDSCDDKSPMDDYWETTRNWLREAYRILKDDGRVAINIPLEVNVQDRGGRILFVSEFWQIMKQIGYKFFGIIDLDEDSPHRSKTTAWGCYDKDTRVMTADGLKYFKDINIDIDQFITINPETGHIEYQKAFDYIEKPHNGELVSIKHRGIDLSITENHNMVLTDTNNNLNVVPYNKIDRKIIIPRKHKGLVETDDIDYIEIPPVEYGLRTKKEYINTESVKIKMDDWLRFLGIFLSDGSLDYSEERGSYKISIYQKKEKFLKEIKELLERLPFDFKYKENKIEYYTCSKQLGNFLIETSSKNNRKIPDYVFKCSVRQKNILLKWLFYGDGSFTPDSELWKISVCSNTMRDQIVRLIFDVGKVCSLHNHGGKERMYNGKLMKSDHPLTTILLINKNKTTIRNKHINRIKYNDNVYCVSVPNRTLLVEKSGQLVWCGNSWMSSSSPYIYNPKECVILAYKKHHIKKTKGTPQWAGEFQMVEDKKNGGERKKLVYSEKDKKDFISLVYGQWNYFADTQQMTKATFSLDIPFKAIKILSYKEDIIFDPFNGSGTTCLAAEMLGRKWIGVDISKNYCEVARKRIGEYRLNQQQTKIVIEETSK